MAMHRLLYGPLIAAALLLPGCVVAPAHRPHYVVAPALPARVELDVMPYYYGGFYYHYHHPDRRWIYSRYKTGPWRELPRDRHPREIRYKDRGGWDRDHRDGNWDRDRDRNWDRDRDRDDRDRRRDSPW